MTDPREMLDKIEQQTALSGSTFTTGDALHFAGVVMPKPHLDALVAALRAVLDLAANADSTATQILTYGVPSGQVSTVELRRRIAEALGGVE